MPAGLHPSKITSSDPSSSGLKQPSNGLGTTSTDIEGCEFDSRPVQWASNQSTESLCCGHRESLVPQLVCANPKCGRSFYSKHAEARFCSRRCANSANQAARAGRPRVYSDEELITELQTLGAKLGRTPSRREIGGALPNKWTYSNRFGSWNNALVLAGFSPREGTVPIGPSGARPSLPLGQRFRVMQRDGFRCVYCGVTPEDGAKLVVDHRIPVSGGGLTADENLATACWPCNVGKSNKVADAVVERAGSSTAEQATSPVDLHRRPST